MESESRLGGTEEARGDVAPRSRGEVGKIMRRRFISVAADESLDDAIRLMRLARLRHLAVERRGVLVGVLSYRDLQDQTLSRLEQTDVAAVAPEPVEVSAAMVDSPYSVDPETSLEEAAARMGRLHVGCLPVVERTTDGPRLVGLIAESDLLAAAFEPPAPG